MPLARWLKPGAALCAVCIVILSFFLRPAHNSAQPASEKPHQKAVRAAAQDGGQESDDTLFPELDGKRITAISVSTPASTFLFHCEDTKRISVNGQRADYDVFHTLLSQITELPVSIHPSFAATDTPLLTLVISTAQGQYTARFYEDDTQEEARIVSGTDSAPQYRSTDAWRVGMLMMTCEGTRIQDERGNETPVQF